MQLTITQKCITMQEAHDKKEYFGKVIQERMYT